MFKRRAAVEPTIGHLKSDNRLSRNHLAGRAGDHINTLLAAAGYNRRQLNAINPHSAYLAFGTAPWCYRTLDVYHLEARVAQHPLQRAARERQETAESEDEQWFNLAAALLVNNGNDLVSTESWELIGPDEFWSGFRTDLGSALGPRRVEGGVIRRDFTRGVVLMNERARAAGRGFAGRR